ncbi:MAG: sigma-70 family RNA polymerase sigma factor [Phycisphaerae bacterium]|nr:sigma-70 family RNA polymerase sigma factor [Phycisphaerae bacterium]
MSKNKYEAEQQGNDPCRNDAEAVARTLRDEADAFDELVHKYQRQAVGVAYRLVGDTHSAADIAQDAFLRAYRGLSSLQDPRRFGPWLMRIVSNLSLNYRRSRKTASSVSLEAFGDGVEGFRRASDAARLTSSPPSEAVDVEDLSTAIEQALQRLPERQRVALTLFSVEGIPQKEVAQMMECSIELVKWNVFQARKAMRKMLADFMG